MGTTHRHADRREANARALTGALGLTIAFMLAEVVGGVLTGSLALISDAAHMFTDSAGLAVALAGMKIAARPADSRRTFGYQRFEILAAAFNAIMLFVVAGYILYEGYQRLLSPPQIQTLPMMGIALVGLGVNLVAMRLLGDAKNTSLNVKGAYLEVWNDMLGSIGVIAAAVSIWLTGWTWVDAAAAIGIGLWVLPRTWELLSETVNVLLEGVPDGLDLEAIASALKSLPNVRDIHDLHVWALTSDSPSLSAHLVLTDGGQSDRTRQAAQSLLSERFDIAHCTLQTEIGDCREERRRHGSH